MKPKQALFPTVDMGPFKTVIMLAHGSSPQRPGRGQELSGFPLLDATMSHVLCTSFTALTHGVFSTTDDGNGDERTGGRGAPAHLARRDPGDTARHPSILKAPLARDVSKLGAPHDYPHFHYGLSHEVTTADVPLERELQDTQFYGGRGAVQSSRWRVVSPPAIFLSSVR